MCHGPKSKPPTALMRPRAKPGFQLRMRTLSCLPSLSLVSALRVAVGSPGIRASWNAASWQPSRWKWRLVTSRRCVRCGDRERVHGFRRVKIENLVNLLSFVRDRAAGRNPISEETALVDFQVQGMAVSYLEMEERNQAVGGPWRHSRDGTGSRVSACEVNLNSFC